MNVTTRFAPSPTGLLHLGNIRTALFNALLAYANGGAFLLRIEDTDTVRSKTEWVEAIQEDLRWLGLLAQLEGVQGVVFQSHRDPIYSDYYRQLEARGAAYACFCTEERLTQLRHLQRLAHEPPGYDGHCRQLSIEDVKYRQAQGEAYHLRFRVPAAQSIMFNDLVKGEQCFKSDHLRDFVIQRSEGGTSFLYCNALDDALMGITHVFRGEDHLSNTAKQLLILQALDLNPPIYGHLPLISHQTNTTPLSKRDNSLSLKSLRRQGYLPQAVLNYLARLGHTMISDALMSVAQLADVFSIERIHKNAAHFDETQLHFWQKKAIHQQSPDEFWNTLDPTVTNRIPQEMRPYFIEVMQPIAAFPSQAQEWITLLFIDSLEYNAEARVAIQQADATLWPQLLKVLKISEAMDKDLLLWQQLKLCLNSVEDKAQRKIHWKALRAALTNRFVGPDVRSIIRLLGISRVRRRLQTAASLSDSNLARC
jgi:nondiscriminating glutamyl-tRNA synthetase